MIVKSLNEVYPQEQELLKEKAVSIVVDQIVQVDHQAALEVTTKRAVAKPRMSVDEVIAFWSCMVPYGWSIGGLLVFLLNRRRKNSGRAISSIIFGLLSTLCYLVAVRQARNYEITQRLQPQEVCDPIGAKDHPGE
jgi:hypothetical protein